MLDMKRIASFNAEKEAALEKERINNRLGYDSLNFFQRKKLMKINSAIRTITFHITKESGWTYIPPYSFTYLSNYHYNGEELLFTINRIDEFELRSNPSKIEIEFFEKYKEALTNLQELLKKKKALIPIDDPKVIAFDSIETKKAIVDKNTRKNIINIGLRTMSTEFIANYQKKGITELITFLNRLVNEPNPGVAYIELQSRVSDPEMVHDILRWAAMYNPKADQILIEIARRQSDLATEEALKPREEESNVIPLFK